MTTTVDDGAFRRGSEQRPGAAEEQRMDWWREARFGLFIHWGLYAIPAGEWQGQADPGHRRVDHAPRAHPGRRVRAAGRAVQPGAVRRRRLGRAGQAGRPEVPDHHLQASRRLLHVRLEADRLRHRRRHAVRARPDEGAGRRLPARRASGCASTTRRPRTGTTRTATATTGTTTRPTKTSTATSSTTSNRRCASC